MLSLPYSIRTPLTLVIVLCFGIIGTIWFQSNTSDTSDEIKTIAGTHTTEWFAKNVMHIKMNKKGQPEYQLWAETLTHYGDNNTTELTQPRFKQFPEKETDNLWLLKSRKGRIFHGDDVTDILRLDLWHNVKLSRPQTAQKGSFDLNTSTVAIFPEQSFATTDQYVLLKQPGHTLEGTGMEMFFETEEIKLLSDVRSAHVAK